MAVYDFNAVSRHVAIDQHVADWMERLRPAFDRCDNDGDRLAEWMSLMGDTAHSHLHAYMEQSESAARVVAWGRLWMEHQAREAAR